MKTKKNIFSRIWERYWQPSARMARIIGDLLLIAAGIIGAYSFSNPGWEDRRVLILIILLIAGKILTNLTVKKDGTA